jgi:hypothetical protein
MNPTIIAALIGGLFSIASIIVTFVITRISDSDIWATRNLRQIALDGRWEASFHQVVGPEGAPIDFLGTITFKSNHRAIQGEGTIERAMQNEKFSMDGTFTGRFIHDRFLKADYQIKNQPGVVQFGCMLAELSPNGHLLTGHFLGFGALSQKIVWGTVEVRKVGAFPFHSVNP